ncbi:MAG: wax ester/triacylglycerol synthase family O-acyltransferase [Pseudomonadota bacterium]
MKRLSGLDASFLYLETPEMPMHVGALHLFELPAGFRGRFVNALRKHMAERLPIAPALRRRLWQMPLNMTNPVWLDAVPDLKQHIVEIKLPRKGNDMAQLEALVGELHTKLLDRSRPLWKFHVIEGLSPGEGGTKRLALYTQLHHAAVDGQAAVALANAILDLSAKPAPLEARQSGRVKRFELGLVEMISGAIGSEVQQITQLIRALPGTVGSLSSAATRLAARSEIVTGKKRSGSLGLAPRTRLNASVTAGRAFATVSLPLHELKALGRLHEATLNDMVLMLCSTALRRHFGKHGPMPRKSLIAAVPVSLRQKGDTRSDNQASMTLISLGTNIADPMRRLAHIKAATLSMKGTLAGVKNILPTDFPSIGVPWLMEAATSLYQRARVADKLPPVANVVISNVPGPPVPLYMAGARMLTNYPCSIVVHGVGLNITVQSYDQSLDFGLMADATAMPEVRELAEALRVAFDDVRALPVDDAEDEAAASAAQVAQGAARNAGKALKRAAGAALDSANELLARPARRAARKAISGAANSAGDALGKAATRIAKVAMRKR